MDLNKELKFFREFEKIKFGGGSGGGGVRLGGGRVGGGGRWVRVDVNAMLGVGVMWGMGM